MLDRFRAIAGQAGFDLVQPFSVEWLSRAGVPFPFAGFGRPSGMGVVVGNTRALWPRFLDALRDDATIRAAEHPLDTYVVRSIEAAARQIPVATRIVWAHATEPEPVAVQRVAEVAGLAKISPSHLSIHARFGPWIAWRAVLLLDADGPAGPAPSVFDPCRTCERPCMGALARALEASGTDERQVQHDASAIPRAWRAWLEVRTVCPVGVEHRYDEEQAEYHYAKRLPMITNR